MASEATEPQELASSLKIWLECLQESGIDLEEYGRKKLDLHQQGLVSWTWNVYPGKNSEVTWSLTSLTYGPSPSDWKIDMELQSKDVAESPRKMPGGWVEDDHGEGNNDIGEGEEGSESEESEDLECYEGRVEEEDSQA